MFVLVALVLLFVWYVGDAIYAVGGGLLRFLLPLALISIVGHLISGGRRRMAWTRADRPAVERTGRRPHKLRATLVLVEGSPP
jgi:hypothetical protein